MADSRWPPEDEAVVVEVVHSGQSQGSESGTACVRFVWWSS